MCFPVFPLKYLTFYNIDEYRNEGAFISKTWDDNLLSNSIHLINDSIKLNSALNPYSNKLVYAISLPLRDKSGNFALLFEEIYYYNIYKIEKYRIFKKYPNEWKLFYEIEK
jgi:hypothetical protein